MVTLVSQTSLHHVLFDLICQSQSSLRTGDSDPYTVHTLNYKPGLNPIYVKVIRDQILG